MSKNASENLPNSCTIIAQQIFALSLASLVRLSEELRMVSRMADYCNVASNTIGEIYISQCRCVILSHFAGQITRTQVTIYDVAPGCCKQRDW